MLDLASKRVFKFETDYGENKGSQPAYTSEEIEEINDMKYEELKDEFLNQIFGYESALDRSMW